MFKKTAKALTSVIVVVVFGTGAALAQETPKPKQAKDEAEVEIYKQASPQTNPNPATRLKALDTWKEKYPETDFKFERALFYALTYQALNQGPKMFEAAKDMLAIDPKEVNALGWITSLSEFVPNTPDNLATSEKAARGLLQAEKPAAGVDDNQWKTQKTAYDALAHKTLGYIGVQRKQLDVAEQEYKKSLEISPAQAAVSYALGRAILSQQKPERYPEMLFHVARAASLTGPGALDPAFQKQVDAFLVKSYTAYHGDDAAGLKELRQLAVGPKPAPPEGFTLKDKATIENEKDADSRSKNPQLYFWNTVRTALTAADGNTYFESGVKGSQLPPPELKKLKGKLVSMKPALRNPKELVLEIEPGKPEVTLKFENALPGKAEPGTEIEFEGVAESFTASPFMLVLSVDDKDKITGWPAQAAAPAAKKAAPGAKKAAPAKK